LAAVYTELIPKMVLFGKMSVWIL